MSVPSWARVGAKVVCINTWACPNDQGLGKVGPIAGNIYTIRAFRDHWKVPGCCVLLTEILNPTYGGVFSGYEACFAIERFRPVHTLRGDVHAIKSALRNMPAETRLDRLLEALDE